MEVSDDNDSHLIPYNHHYNTSLVPTFVTMAVAENHLTDSTEQKQWDLYINAKSKWFICTTVRSENALTKINSKNKWWHLVFYNVLHEDQQCLTVYQYQKNTCECTCKLQQTSLFFTRMFNSGFFFLKKKPIFPLNEPALGYYYYSIGYDSRYFGLIAAIPSWQGKWIHLDGQPLETDGKYSFWASSLALCSPSGSLVFWRAMGFEASWMTRVQEVQVSPWSQPNAHNHAYHVAVQTAKKSHFTACIASSSGQQVELSCMVWRLHTGCC